MVDDVGDIKAFLQFDKYSSLAEKIVQRANKRLCTDIYDAEVTYCQKILGAATVSLADIRSLLVGDAEKLERFCVRLIRAEKLLNLGQDFNPYEPEEQEEENEVYVGHSKTFLLTFSVLYLLLRDERSKLSAYLKVIRQPKAVKYQRGIELVFDSL
jgi:hypothetical protein